MPAFTFEKISPPARRGQTPPSPKKQRNVIYQIIDRFVEARAKRGAGKARGVFARRKAKSSD
jgi:hypothetical protein